MGGGPVCFPETTSRLAKNSGSKKKCHTVLKKIIKNNSDFQLQLGAPDTIGSGKKLGCLLFVSACGTYHSGVTKLWTLYPEIEHSIPGLRHRALTATTGAGGAPALLAHSLWRRPRCALSSPRCSRRSRSSRSSRSSMPPKETPTPPPLDANASTVCPRLRFEHFLWSFLARFWSAAC